MGHRTISSARDANSKNGWRDSTTIIDDYVAYLKKGIKMLESLKLMLDERFLHKATSTQIVEVDRRTTMLIHSVSNHAGLKAGKL